MPGQYKMVARLGLDRTRVGEADLFRLEEFKLILICSEVAWRVAGASRARVAVLNELRPEPLCAR